MLLWLQYGASFIGNLGVLLFIPTVIPSIIFTIYLLFCHEKFKGYKMLPIIFAFILITPAIFITATFLDALRFAFMSLENLIIDIPFIIFCVLSLVSTLKGISMKLPIFITMLFGVVKQIYLIAKIMHFDFDYFRHNATLAFVAILYAISLITLYIALMIFCTNNKIPKVFKRVNTSNPSVFTEETSLKALKYQLELGLITTEEYEAKRNEILKDL